MTAQTASLPKIAIALGDPAGIGPEIAMKAALDPRVQAIARPLLVGDRRVLEMHAKACGIDVGIHEVSSADVELATGANHVSVLHRDQFPGELPKLGTIDAEHGRSAVDSARAAIAAGMAKQVAGVIACPQTEMAIHKAGIEFDGYPSFVARCTGTPAEETYLMLCFGPTRIVHATLHLSLRKALDLVDEYHVLKVLQAAHKTLTRNGKGPRIAIAGVNPHASEGGMFGDEETVHFKPAMEKARAEGINVEGPFGADTMFKMPGYDAFVVMYHDQGHLAAKLLATNRTAGMTIGTPIVFSSVAHGSALDIAGQNKASPEAVVEAVVRVTDTALGR